MHRRARHLNPAHAGALVVLDARFGFAQADNTDVSTWPDRSANAANATQATSAYQPKYRTAVTGGSPAIQFTAASDSKDRLDGTISILNDAITSIAVLRLDTGAPSFARALALSNGGANDYDSSLRTTPIVRNGTNNQLGSSRNSAVSANLSISLDAFCHVTSTYDGTNLTNRLNESTSASVASTGNFAISQYRVGMAYDNTTPESNPTGAWTGYIAHVSIFNAALSASLRKRLQQANALAFKTPCN